MEDIKREFLTDYFNATVNRYYTAQEKARLFGFFTLVWGLYGDAARELEETVRIVDGYGIRTLQDCGTFALCRMKDKDDAIAEGLDVLFSVMRQAQPLKWHDLIGWRMDVFNTPAAGEDPQNALERARIHIAENKPEEAIAVLQSHNDPESLRYQYVLHEQTGNPEDALYCVMVAERMTSKLHTSLGRLDADALGRRRRLEARLTPTEIDGLQKRVEGLNMVGMTRRIGF